MKKQYNDSVFSKNSITSLSRTLYKKSQDHKMSMNAGKLIPIFIDEVIPGDNFKINYSSLIYAVSPNKKPIMDKLVVDVYSFFVPKRLLDKNFEKIWCNYQPNADYTDDVDLSYAKIKVPNQGFGLHSLADYLGVPIGVGGGKEINHLPFRACVKVWDEWFRPQYLQSSIWDEEIPDSSIVNGVSNAYGDFVTDMIRGGALPPVAKTKDYFTTCLPFPQVGAGEFINLGTTAPVKGFLPLSAERKTTQDIAVLNQSNYELNGALKFADGFGDSESGMYHQMFVDQYRDIGALDGYGEAYGKLYAGSAQVGSSVQQRPITGTNLVGEASENAFHRADIPEQHRLMVDLSSATGVSIRELRWVFQSQLVKEMDLFGNRLFETINIHFGVVASDSRFQRSEFLGHSKFYIGSYQVTQTSQSTIDNPMGGLSSYMVGRTQDQFLVNKAFPEPGYLLIFACVRIANHTYAQGLNRMFSKFVRFDDMWPAFSTVGDQETKLSEIYFDSEDGLVFGYQTRYAEYKYLPDRVSGLMRPTADGGQLGDLYAFTDYYASTPYLSASWIWEDASNIDRTFALSSQVTGAQFVAQWYFKVDNIRVTMSGQPGLVDHSHRTIW